MEKFKLIENALRDIDKARNILREYLDNKRRNKYVKG